MCKYAHQRLRASQATPCTSFTAVAAVFLVLAAVHTAASDHPMADPAEPLSGTIGRNLQAEPSAMLRRIGDAGAGEQQLLTARAYGTKDDLPTPKRWWQQLLDLASMQTANLWSSAKHAAVHILNSSAARPAPAAAAHPSGARTAAPFNPLRTLSFEMCGDLTDQRLAVVQATILAKRLGRLALLPILVGNTQPGARQGASPLFDSLYDPSRLSAAALAHDAHVAPRRGAAVAAAVAATSYAAAALAAAAAVGTTRSVAVVAAGAATPNAAAALVAAAAGSATQSDAVLAAAAAATPDAAAALAAAAAVGTAQSDAALANGGVPSSSVPPKTVHLDLDASRQITDVSKAFSGLEDAFQINLGCSPFVISPDLVAEERDLAWAVLGALKPAPALAARLLAMLHDLGPGPFDYLRLNVKGPECKR